MKLRSHWICNALFCAFCVVVSDRFTWCYPFCFAILFDRFDVLNTLLEHGGASSEEFVLINVLFSSVIE